MVAMSGGNAGVRRNCAEGGNAGNDLKRNIGLCETFGFFTSTTKKKRVTTL